MTFTAAALHAALIAHLPATATGLVVALSGGADSAALLAAVASLPDRHAGLPVRAVHVDHGLQSAAAAFRTACRRQCVQAGVPLRILQVQVALDSGESVEAAARDARYAALADELAADECLLTAHHAHDQAETLLLQSLRGAGLKGLSAMPPCQALGGGWHVRPLLDIAQSDLLRLGSQLNAGGEVDPMNQDVRFDRNFLRQELWPRIEARWPGAASALARGARHLASAQNLLDATAAAEVGRLRDGAALSIPGLRALQPARRVHALRWWLHEAGVELPSEARVVEALRQMLEAAADHLPTVVWGEHALRRYRQRLFLTDATPPHLQQALQWPLRPGACLTLPPGLGALRCVSQAGGLDLSRLSSALSVRRREGGESLKTHALARTHSVQHLCQEFGVLPWLRDSLPLLFDGEELVAVGDLWLDARWCVAANVPGVALNWENGPVLV
jgi:tRNA(Ile)-lysidine synthase